MAKLSARGRKELVRATKVIETPDSDLTVKRQVSYAVMSDRRILKREVCWFRNEYAGRHDYSWKEWKRYKVDVDLQSKAKHFAKDLAEKGWSIAYDTLIV